MISLKTHKMLWGRAANICAFPNCKKALVVDETETDDPSIIGEEAHMVGQKESGPRGISSLNEEERDKYSNLILLCRNHHKVVDDQDRTYPVEKLKEFKENHEKWVLQNLITDKKKIKEDELYATYIEHFINATDLHNWNNWTSWMLGSSESFPKERFNELEELSNYIVGRIWPGRYIKLERALINFKNVLNDLISVFNKYSDERPKSFGIQRFYRHYNGKEIYSQVLEKYNYHVALVEDLLIELTRAANYICDRIREYIFEGFRLKEGVLLITRGDMLQYQSFRVEYRDSQRIDQPYPGLNNFMTEREQRDFHIGKGVCDDYFTGISY
jgi:hypothetical protein